MSRYSFFTETAEGYPDIYSLDNSIFESIKNIIPVTYQITQPEAERFDLLMTQFYGSTEYMWIVLWHNGLSTIFELSAGMYLSFPSPQYLATLQETGWRR